MDLIKLQLWILLFLAGCAGSSRYMLEDETPEPAESKAGQATIVFVRPSGFGYAITFTVLDAEGNFVGQMPAKGHVVHHVPPGSHRFLIWGENTAVMESTVEAGKVYYVEVDAAMGMWAARAHLLPVRRGTDEWDEAEEWVEDTAQWDVTPELAKQWTEDKKTGIAGQIERGKLMWAKYDDEEKTRRTLRAEDGR
ncbi:MAG: hypothetical protein ACYTGN_10590 [Planctomycetota bacterium]|jgi:hypothetical protein